MDEKTAELRDIFLSVAGNSTLTERQEETRGSLVTDADISARLRETLEELRSQCECDTSLSNEQLVTVIQRFYAGESDSEIARAIGVEDPQTVTHARIAIHLVTDDDMDASFDLDQFRERIMADNAIADIAAELDVSLSTVRQYRLVINAVSERRRVNDRFRVEFERILDDRDLTDQLTKDIRETGLRDATDGMETNVSF